MNAGVCVDIGGSDHIVAIVTSDFAKELGLTRAESTTVVIKASSVILGIAA